MIDLSAKAIAEWIGDRNGKYNYCDPDHCAIAQYLEANGGTDVCGGPFYADYVFNGEEFKDIKIPTKVELAVNDIPADFQSLKQRLLAVAE